MYRPKNDKKSISFSWSAFTHKLRWANSPDEVPLWDMSRGFSVTDDYESFDHKKALPAPIDGYPRLVRDSLASLGSLKVEVEDDVINNIGQLANKHWLSGKRQKTLRRKVLHLSEMYGPPYRYSENTLADWLKLAIDVRTHLWAARILRKNGYEPMKQALIRRHRRIRTEAASSGLTLGPRPLTYAELKKAHSFNLENPFPVSGSLQEKELTEIELLLYVAVTAEKDAKLIGKRVTSLYRYEMAARMYDHRFAISVNSIGHGDDKGILMLSFHQGTRLLCPVGFWIGYHLSELWRTGQYVERCPVCRTLFIATRTNTKYCKRGTCADKAYRDKRLLLHNASK